jgi:hypothetical protein
MCERCEVFEHKTCPGCSKPSNDCVCWDSVDIQA